MTSTPADATNWRSHLLESGDQIRDLLNRIKRIAVLGIKTEAQSFQPAYFGSSPLPAYRTRKAYPSYWSIFGRCPPRSTSSRASG